MSPRKKSLDVTFSHFLYALESAVPLRSVIPPYRRSLHDETALKKVAPPNSKGQLQAYSREPQYHHSKIVQKEHKQFPPPSKSRQWQVNDSLQPRPMDIPLDNRSSRLIHGVTASVVANRIANCLQARSIMAKFSTTETLAKCRNTRFVNFHIWLFRESEGILVEVQLMCGDCMYFMRDCRAILNAADGQAYTIEDEKPLFLSLPISQMAFAKNLPPLMVEDESESVNIAVNLISSKWSDSNMLGMESIVSLTNTSKTCKSTAVIASKRVLCPNDEGDKSFDLHNHIMSLIIYGNDSEDSSFFEGTSLQDYHTRLRNLALRSVANALALLNDEKSLLSSICQNWYADVLIPKLIHHLSKAGNHPHDACYASRCLSTLAVTSRDFVNKIVDTDGEIALKNAREVGNTEFALLAQDAEICHNAILRCR